MISILSKDDYLNSFIIEQYSNLDTTNYKGSPEKVCGLSIQSC